jgi:hypothetical protein
MGLFGDERAQAIQVGAVLIFAIIIIFLSTYQAFVVPNQNEEIEFNHNQEARQQMTDLRSNIILMPGSSSTRAASVDLGVRYPSRALFVNPGPASGSLRTVATEDSAFNLTLEHIQAVDEEGETGDFWNGTTVTYNTGAIEFRPGYNLYQNAPLTIYEHSVLYNNFTREGVTQAVTEQSIIDGKQITLIAINGSMSESRVGTTSVDFNPISTRTRTVSINNTGDPITISLATGMSEDEWQNSTLEDELAKNGGYVQSVDVRPGGPDGFNILDLTLQPNERYQLEVAKVGVGTGATDTSPAYLTAATEDSFSVQEGSSQRIPVEVRDKFNGPLSGVTVRGPASLVSDASVETGPNGEAVFEYQPPNDIDGQKTLTEQINLSIDIDPSASSGSFNGSTPGNVTLNVTVENTDGSGLGSGGGGGGPYNISFSETEIDGEQGMNCNDGCVYDLADDPDGEFNLTAVTAPTVVGAEVDFALNTTASGDFTGASDAETDTNGEAKGVFDVTDTGGIEAYVTSGGSGDTIEINIKNTGAQPIFSAFEPAPTNTDEFVRVYLPTKISESGWVFSDGDQGQETAIPTGIQGEIYFAPDPSGFAQQWGINPNRVKQLNTALNNNGEALKLNDSSGNIVDQVAYEGKTTTRKWTLDVNSGDVAYRKMEDGGYRDKNNAADWNVTSESSFFGEFTVSNITVNDPVTEGENLEVTATIKNTGEVERTQKISLRVDANQDGTFTTVNSTKTSPIAGGGSEQVTLTYTTQTGDAPAIDLSVASEDNSAEQTATVNEPAFFNVTLDSVNSSVSPGDDVVVDYTIENTGDIQGTQDITFEVNGTQEDTNSSVSLEGGSSTSGRFRYTTGSGDTPQITVKVSSDNESATETVTVNEPPFFEMNITGTNSPVKEGETLTVNVNVTNTGDVADTQTLNLTDTGFNNTERDTIEVSLGPGQSNTSIALNWSTSNGDTGTGNVTAYSDNDSATAQIEVTSSTANQIQYVSGSGSAGSGPNKGVVSFNLSNTGTSTASITGIIINSTTKSNTDIVDNGGDNEFEGAGGFVNVGEITVGATSITTLDTTADIGGGTTEMFTLREFRKNNGNIRNMKNKDVTLTLYFDDGSSLTITVTASG